MKMVTKIIQCWASSSQTERAQVSLSNRFQRFLCGYFVWVLDEALSKPTTMVAYACCAAMHHSLLSRLRLLLFSIRAFCHTKLGYSRRTHPRQVVMERISGVDWEIVTIDGDLVMLLSWEG